MTMEQVEAMLGPGQTEDDTVFSVVDGERTYSRAKFWQDGGRTIYVRFRNDRVCTKGYHEISLWQRIQDWYEGTIRFPDGCVARRLKAAA
jgi:hypothetical protein